MTENTVDPSGTLDKLSRKWDVAALYLDIPTKLIDEENQRRWGYYVSCLRPSQLVKIFGGALDLFHDAVERVNDFSRISRADGIRLYSLWEATEIIACEVGKRLEFADKDVSSGKIDDDIAIALHYVIDLMEGVRSPALKDWEFRDSRHYGLRYDQGYCEFMANAWKEYPEKPVVPPKPAP